MTITDTETPTTRTDPRGSDAYQARVIALLEAVWQLVESRPGMFDGDDLDEVDAALQHLVEALAAGSWDALRIPVAVLRRST